MTLLLTILAFGLMIFVHELGHFLMAKAWGVGIEQFSIG
ncbi:MAG: RIP metalloprotease RseP, partial [Candidatus Cloacimonetes bacterium]|nr:RIP metalloprotease RseP [Candidatus Cloacimonadota bacterium]